MLDIGLDPFHCEIQLLLADAAGRSLSHDEDKQRLVQDVWTGRPEDHESGQILPVTLIIVLLESEAEVGGFGMIVAIPWQGGTVEGPASFLRALLNGVHGAIEK